MIRRELLSLLAACTLSLFAQDTPTAPPADEESEQPAPVPVPGKAQFFSGTVTDVESDHVTVSRTLVGKAPETRTFLINPETNKPKSLRSKARVTVRYRHEGESDVALEIRIHASHTPRTS